MSVIISPANHSQKSPLIRIHSPAPAQPENPLRQGRESTRFQVSTLPDRNGINFVATARLIIAKLPSNPAVAGTSTPLSALRPLLTAEQVDGRVGDATRRQRWTGRFPSKRRRGQSISGHSQPFPTPAASQTPNARPGNCAQCGERVGTPPLSQPAR